MQDEGIYQRCNKLQSTILAITATLNLRIPKII